MPECTGKFLAKLFDLTERRIQQLALDGKTVRLGRGKYDLFPSIKGYTKFLREQAKAEEKKLVEENRKIKEIKRKELEGEYVDAAEVEHELINLFSTIKTRIRSIGPK